MGSGATTLDEANIAVLYRAGRIQKDTPCAELGKDWWRTIDEMFPLLKYDAPPGTTGGEGSGTRASQLRYSDQPTGAMGSGRPLTSALTAGWICFGIGAAVSWFFPLGYGFFSVAVIFSIVAMATHQVSRGLILMLGSFVAVGVSAIISLVLAVGLFAAAADQVLAKVKEETKKQQGVISRQTGSMNRAFAQALGAPVSTPGRRPASSLPAASDDFTRQVQQLNGLGDQSMRTLPQAPASSIRRAYAPQRSAPPAPAAPQATPYDTSVEAQLRRIAAQQSARESYKQQSESLRKSIDFWQDAQRHSRSGGHSSQRVEQEIASLQKRLQELNAKNPGF